MQNLTNNAPRRRCSLRKTLTGARSIMKKLALSIGSLLVVLIVLELLIRGYFSFVNDSLSTEKRYKRIVVLPDSDRAYALKPLLPPPRKTNSHGFRGEEVTVRKAENRYRILMLGDSITAGNGVAWNETFSFLLQQDLNEGMQGRFEVLNLGVSGYNTRQELATLRELGLRFSPDLIVLNVCLNDSDPVKIVVQAGLKNTTSVSNLFDINIRTIISSSYVLTFGKKTLISVLGGRNFGNTLNSPRLFLNPRVKEVAWETMKEDMSEIHATCIRHGLPFAVVIYPYSSQVKLPDAERVPQNDLVEFWNSKDVPVMDAVYVYQNSGQSMFVDSVLHLSPYGHMEVANAMREFLQASGFLPSLIDDDSGR